MNGKKRRDLNAVWRTRAPTRRVSKVASRVRVSADFDAAARDLLAEMRLPLERSGFESHAYRAGRPLIDIVLETGHDLASFEHGLGKTIPPNEVCLIRAKNVAERR